MVKCTLSERLFVKTLHNAQLWSNIMYVISAIVALIGRKWDLAVCGFIISIISTLHHQFNYVDATCVQNYHHKPYHFLSTLDVVLANILSIYSLYTIWNLYRQGKTLNRIIIGFCIICSITAIAFFIVSSYYEKLAVKLSKKGKIDSQLYLKNAGLYEFYHGYWHIFSGISFGLIVTLHS